MGKHNHPGWTDRIKLDRRQTKAQGEDYVQGCTMVLREVLLRQWANDPRNGQWHPAPRYGTRIELQGDPTGDEYETWLVGHMDAVYLPEDVPAEVLDHEHTVDCEHILVPFVTGHRCDVCGNQFIAYRLCARRCVSTSYAVSQILRSWEQG